MREKLKQRASSMQKSVIRQQKSTDKSSRNSDYEVPNQIRGLLAKYNNWVVMDMPRISYREYQNIRVPIVAKMAELVEQDHVFVLPAVDQSIHFMEALMSLRGKFVVVLPREISNEIPAVRNTLKKVAEYEQALIIEHDSRRKELINRAKGFLDNRNSSDRAKHWAKSVIAKPKRADYIDGLRAREFIMRSVIDEARSPKFISIFRGEPEYMSADLVDSIPTWKIDLWAQEDTEIAA